MINGRASWFLAILIVTVDTFAHGRANGNDPNLVAESWESAHLDGVRVGFVHITTRRLGDPATNRTRTTEELDLTFRRRNALLQVRMEHGTDEAADGRVIGVFMRQFQGRKQQLALTGSLEDGHMHVRVDNGRLDRRIGWSDEVVGLYGQGRLFREKPLSPGDTRTFLGYEPIVNCVVTRRAKAIGLEETSIGGERRSLMRVEVVPDRVRAPGVSVQLPKSILWLDTEGTVQRRQIELDGLGEIALARTTREAATIANGPPTVAPEIGMKTLVPLDRAATRPMLRTSAVYRIHVRGELEAAAAFAQDAHQEIRASRGEDVELVVHPLRTPRGRGEARPGTEFLAASYFIDNDDDRIQTLARQAVGPETDAWRAAVRIERWVNQNMRPDHAAPMAPASQAARSQRGDCRHYALLTAALCRATGIPSRTAVGLIPVERGDKSYFGFHLWTEVCVEGHWRGLDATLGMGGVGAGHLKVADHSWQDTRSLTPFLPVQRLLGKMTVQLVE